MANNGENSTITSTSQGYEKTDEKREQDVHTKNRKGHCHTEMNSVSTTDAYSCDSTMMVKLSNANVTPSA